MCQHVHLFQLEVTAVRESTTEQNLLSIGDYGNPPLSIGDSGFLVGALKRRRMGGLPFEAQLLKHLLVGVKLGIWRSEQTVTAETRTRKVNTWVKGQIAGYFGTK
jgi:hypothetical protein